ncbi:imm11 family protein [Rummeliibacillus pycnus]|uniref:imm11 family protein n=1 Tax=Rummeliibacillus pycnus TaxID=101070 RepID=UPI0037C9087B
MRYFKLLKDYSNEREIFCLCENTFGWEQYELSEGKQISNWDEKITFYYNPIEGNLAPDYIHNNLSWFIVSPLFETILNEIDNGGVQFLPINIINKENDSSIPGYSIANVVNVIEAINYENSTYSVFELDDDKFYDFTKYALNENEIKGKHIFKLKGDEIPIFVSELVKELIEKNNITGCDFLEVEVTL